MKIYVVGNSRNRFHALDKIRTKYLIDKPKQEDNIDFLNPWYCELVGLYHLWKNCTDDIVGLEHYRRYFADSRNRLLSQNDINRILSNHDVICCLYKDRKTVFNGFKAHRFGTNDFFSLVKELPNYELGRNYLCSNNFIVFNMFICKKEIIDEYCDWFFNNITQLEFHKEYKRYVGYIAEYIFGAWLHSKKLKLYYSNYVVNK